MAAWRSEGLPSAARRDVILFATRKHDDGWIEEDRSPLVDEESGRLLDFVNVPDSVKQRIWPRGIGLLASTPYPAALVAAHALHIFKSHRADRAWDPFFVRMERARAAHLAASGLTADELDRDYAFVRLGDLLSLTFCNAWRDTHSDDKYEARCEGSRLVITPDPFNGEQVPLTIAARQLPNRSYSRAEASEAFARAPVVTLTGIASGV
jgi:hypothetical protein